MGVWTTQLELHRDEGIERMGLNDLALPKLTLLQTAQLLGWWRARRGALLDKKWWRRPMARIASLAKKKGWAVRVPTELGALAWAALEKVSLVMDRLAPSGKVSRDDAYSPSGSQEVPGMLRELGIDTSDPVKAAGYVPKLTNTAALTNNFLPPPGKLLPIPKIDPGKVPRPPVLRPKKPSTGFAWLLVLFALGAANHKRKTF